MSFVEGYRKFADFPKRNSWTNLKRPGKCVTGVGWRYRVVGELTGDSVAQWYGVRTVSERPWVRAPVEPQFFTGYTIRRFSVIIMVYVCRLRHGVTWPTALCYIHWWYLDKCQTHYKLVLAQNWLVPGTDSIVINKHSSVCYNRNKVLLWSKPIKICILWVQAQLSRTNSSS